MLCAPCQRVAKNSCRFKLRKVAYAIKNSPTIVIPKWFLTSDKLGLGHRMMPWDVSTRWNSTYDMLLFSLKYRGALNIITGDREMKLCQYEMDNKEWAIAGQLSNVLKVFKDATLYFSRGGTPNIATVIPAMDHIDEVLATSASDSEYSVSILQAALAMGKKTPNRYYSKTDFSEVYRIAMGK